MMVSEVAVPPGRAIGAPMRHEFKSRLRSLAERASVIVELDPKIQQEIKVIGLDRALNHLYRGRDQTRSAEFGAAIARVQSIRKRERGGPAPLKHLRRELRRDALALLELGHMLSALAPEANDEMERLGVAEAIDHIATQRGRSIVQPL